ncbi:hypothetical protein GOBAR_AA19326 [Gossypium barbadense]|uniref:Uncharacterized protein n=1 Tax=Gossypium barbadense TaxID=3634 RepID=A0A2P5XDG3_GOSBA|nr:hypothetical protein GOBAR_AA19326 [Gossypium barbadense]
MKLRKPGYPNELREIIRRGVDIKYACTWLCPPRNCRSMMLQRPVKINTINIGFRGNRPIIESRSNRSTRFKSLAGIRITFIIGTGLLLAGAALNDRHDEVIVKNGGYYCYVIKPGVFATGAVLAAVSSIFGVFYYQTLKEKGTSNVEIPNQGGIVRAQPQFQIQNSGFVNEDAYKL